MKRVSRIATLAVLALAMLASVTMVAAAAPRAQSGSAKTVRGVEGNSYTSPTFGYSLSWDSTWNVVDEKVQADYNLVSLSNGTSSVYLEGIPSADDVDACLAAAVKQMKAETGVSKVVKAASKSGPLEGRDSARAWAVYNLTYTAGDNTETALSDYLDCRPVDPGKVNLVITQIVPADKFETEIDPLLKLTGSLSLDGSTPAADETPVDSSTATATGGDAGTADLPAFIQQSLKDVDAFWVREYPLIAVQGKYSGPKALKTFDGAISTGCGAVKASEVGKVGPFYCSADLTIYYDLAFGAFQIKRFGSRSVVSVALAHEIGHHIQELEGWKECSAAPCLDPTELTSQEIELQADCFAGAWTADAAGRGRLGSVDVETNIAQFALLLGDQNGTEHNADAGTHGNGAQRTHWFLNGYFEGVTKCLTVSAATNPALNGQAAVTATPAAGNSGDLNTGGDTPTPAADRTTPTPDPGTAGSTPDAGSGPETTIAIDDSFDAPFGKGSSATLKITGSDLTDTVADGVKATGQYLVVYFTLNSAAKTAGTFNFGSLTLTDGKGNVYSFDKAATDALLKTGLPGGVNEKLDVGTDYTLAVVYDVPAGSSGFTVVTADGKTGVQLDK